MAIIHLQRRMVQVGRIRLGTKDGNRPVRLDTWRLTSRDRKRLDAAAVEFGGTVASWEAKPGEFELITEVSDLPIMLLPGQTLSQWMELWSGGGCKRRCDGDTETLSDGPCLCDSDKPECKPHTRLNVMLPDVPGLGMWRLDSTGWNAARELAGTAEFLEQATARGVLLPARLRIDQRTELREGQTKKYPVPVLDVDIRTLDAHRIASVVTAPEIEAAPAFTPIAAISQNGVSVSEGLAAAARKSEPKTQSARSASPIGPEGDFMQPGHVPVLVDNGDGSTTTKPSAMLTKAQSKKLDVVVTKLRESGRITTEQLWAAMAKVRSLEAELMVTELDGRDGEGVLHWGPLRESLLRAEATSLIDRLERLEQPVPA